MAAGKSKSKDKLFLTLSLLQWSQSPHTFRTEDSETERLGGRPKVTQVVGVFCSRAGLHAGALDLQLRGREDSSSRVKGTLGEMFQELQGKVRVPSDFTAGNDGPILIRNQKQTRDKMP